MRVEIVEDAFFKGDLEDLHHLINTCLYRNHHTVRVPYHKIKASGNYTDLNKRDRTILEATFESESFSTKSPAQVRISEERKTSNYLNIEEAIRYLKQPVGIVLENNLNDQFFFDAIVKHLADDNLLSTHFKNGWIEYINGGGCDNIPNVLEGKANSFINLPKEKNHYLRVYILFDSDSKYPNAPLKDSYKKIFPKLQLLGIPFHLLHKRSMENYLPDEAFSEIGSITKEYKLAYLRMNSEQKDFFSIQKGFENVSDRTALEPDVQTLYSSLNEEDFLILKQGAKMANFKSEFPKYMTHHSVHRSTLNGRQKDQPDPNELQKILMDLKELL